MYEIEDAEGHVALVMELVEGETLAKRLSRSRPRIEETLAIATQIAEALEAAHRKGVVHRDLKPGNVMITRGGLIKVLDFGLAKRSQTPNAADTTDATRTAALCSRGAVLGTAGYMSPEQAEGEEVDHCSDIFSFGAVLYEMVAGWPAFGGDTAVQRLASVLRDEPAPLEHQAADAPKRLLRVIRLCLRKELTRLDPSDPGAALRTLRGPSPVRKEGGEGVPARATGHREFWPLRLPADLLRPPCHAICGATVKRSDPEWRRSLGSAAGPLGRA